MSALTALLIRSLCGEPKPTGERAVLLWECRYIRAEQAWMKRGCYGWWRYVGYLRAQQRRLLELRKGRVSR